jgi:hypothetical protein
LSCAWTVSPGTPASPATAPSFTFTAGAAGPATLRCELTDASGAVVQTATRTVQFVPAPAALPVTVQAVVNGEQAGCTASVPEQPGCTYQWTVTNATLTAGATSHSVTFTAGDIGDIDFTCTVSNQALASAVCAGTRTITPLARCTDSAFMPNGKPYLQLGTAPASSTTLALVWLSDGDHDADWHVDVHAHGAWAPQAGSTFVRVRVPGEPEHRVYTQPLAGLPAGATFTYRVRIGATVVFQNSGRSLKRPDQPQRVVIAGDLVSGDRSPARRMADRLFSENPDLFVVPGDIVNLEGHAGQYRDVLFPIYNSTVQGPGRGAPLMRSIPMATCLGNNDTDRVGEHAPRGGPSPRPNGLAYYYYFANPLNGPLLTLNNGPVNNRGSLSPWLHPAANFAGFLAAAGDRYLRMGNYAFDSGNVHWVVLDSCLYMRYWQSAALRAWLQADLAASSQRWKFVVFHHPVFSHHGDPAPPAVARPYEEKWMRQIWPILEAGGVDMTFSGHLHAYQRAQPLRFAPHAGPLASERNHYYPDEPPATSLIQDLAFTGVPPHTVAHGILPIITGGGGAHFHNYTVPPAAPARNLRATRFLKNTLSYSLLDIDGDTVRFRQMGYDPLSGAWTPRDEFTLTK